MRRALGCVAIVAVGLALALALGNTRHADASPLGTRSIAFTCGERIGLGIARRRICLWDGDADPRVITRETDGGDDEQPTWSADGSRIAFVHGVSKRDDLFVVDADGSHRTRVAKRLPTSSAFETSFAWAPAGRQIAVSVTSPAPRTAGSRRTNTGADQQREAARARAQSELYLVDLASGHRRRLTTNRVFDGCPTWVGSQLVYARWVSSPSDAQARRGIPARSEIRVIDGVSGRDRLLRRVVGHIVALAGSPDGRRVAAVDEDRRGPSLAVLDVRGGRSTVLVHAGAGSADWSPDGRLIATVLYGSALRVIDTQTREVRRTAATDPCLGPDWSPDAATLICSRPYGEADEELRGGSDLVLVDPVTGQPTRLTTTGAALEGRWRPVAPVPDAGP